MQHAKLKTFGLPLVCLFVFLMLYPSVQGLRNWMTSERPASIQQALHIGDPNPEEFVLDKEYALTTYNLNGGIFGESHAKNDQENITLEQFVNNLAGITKALKDSQSSLLFLQNVDRLANRSLKQDMFRLLEDELLGSLNFAYTEKSTQYALVPWQENQKLQSGLMSISHFLVEQAERIYLGESSAFALRQVLNIENSSKQLILYNLHLGEDLTKEQVLNSLKTLGTSLQEDKIKGHAVIVGGNLGKNLIFTQDSAQVFLENVDLLEAFGLDPSWTIALDKEKPSARNKDINYKAWLASGERTTPYATQDFFLVSSDVKVYQTYIVSTSFEYSANEPLKLIFSIPS